MTSRPVKNAVAAISAKQKGWQGLTTDEVCELILEIAPPLHRAERLRGTAPCEAASKLTSYLITQVIEAKTFQDPARRTGRTISQQLGQLLGRQTTYVSAFRTGSLSTSDTDAKTWENLRRAFRWLLTGNNPGRDTDCLYTYWVDRLTRYFFERRGERPPTFFAEQALGNASPQGPEEAIFNVLWTANRVLHHQRRASIVLLSGDIAFGHVNDEGVLTDTGKAIVLAAAAGVRIFFVFPEESNGVRTPADHSATAFKEAMHRFIDLGETSPEASCVFHRYSNDAVKAYIAKAPEKIHIQPVNLAQSGLVPGFFTPSIRFTGLRTYDRDALEWRSLFLVRRPESFPTMYELGEVEERQFYNWCKNLQLPLA